MRLDVILGVVAVAVAALAAWWFAPTGPPPPPTSSTTVVAASADQLVVHVSGAVVRPGLVQVRPGSRVADAVAAAGGSTASADLRLLNLAAHVSDGQQIIVPSEGDGPVGTTGDGRLRINEAASSDLESLPGVGPVLAARIVAYRDTNGPFEMVEDLLGVPGIGEATLANLRDLISVP